MSTFIARSIGKRCGHQMVHIWMINNYIAANDKTGMVYCVILRLYFVTTCIHYCDVIMGGIASQITTIVYSTVYSDADQRKHQSSASLSFVWGIHRSGEFFFCNAENVFILWRHHICQVYKVSYTLRHHDHTYENKQTTVDVRVQGLLPIYQYRILCLNNHVKIFTHLYPEESSLPPYKLHWQSQAYLELASCYQLPTFRWVHKCAREDSIYWYEYSFMSI